MGWIRRQGDTDTRRMLVAGFGFMVGAMAIQFLAFRHGGHGSISDLPRVFPHRGIRPGSLPYLDRAIEYPVLASVLLYLASLLSATPIGVLIVTGVAAAALFLMVTLLLARRFGHRAWRWAVATPVLVYAFQNWDMSTDTSAASTRSASCAPFSRCWCSSGPRCCSRW